MRFEGFLRRARELAVLVAFGLGVTACTASTSVPEAVPSGTTSSSTSNSAPATKAPARTTSPAARSASGNSIFAGKIIWAELGGYDAGHQMIEFRLLVRYPSTTKQDDYDYDPKDTIAHRLPLATAATIAGIGGGGSQICPTDTSRCTADQLIALLKNRPTSPLIVQLVMNSADAISAVNEQIGELYDPSYQ